MAQSKVFARDAFAFNEADRRSRTLPNELKNAIGHRRVSIRYADLVSTAFITPMLDEIAYLVHVWTKNRWAIC